jgi:hypothetical protein
MQWPAATAGVVGVRRSSATNRTAATAVAERRGARGDAIFIEHGAATRHEKLP